MQFGRNINQQFRASEGERSSAGAGMPNRRVAENAINTTVNTTVSNQQESTDNALF